MASAAMFKSTARVVRSAVLHRLCFAGCSAELPCDQCTPGPALLLAVSLERPCPDPGFGSAG